VCERERETETETEIARKYTHTHMTQKLSWSLLHITLTTYCTYDVLFISFSNNDRENADLNFMIIRTHSSPVY
jgi:hypothetical protein